LRLVERKDQCIPVLHKIRPVTPVGGGIVEIRQNSNTVRERIVEMVMPDGSGFWLAAEGADKRVYVPVSEWEQM
jgi:hypothetical protein